MSNYKTPNGRLTLTGVEKLRKLRSDGKTYQAIAEELGVSLTTVYNVVKQKSHKK